VKDSKGIRYLAKLLAKPTEEFSAFALANPDAVAQDFRENDLETTDSSSLQEYKARLREIEEDLEEAKVYEREEEIKSLEDEKDGIIRHLSEVSGVGGRSRLEGEKEKSRQSVSRALNRQVDALPIGSDHIKRRLKTGVSCTYTPDAGEVWKVSI